MINHMSSSFNFTKFLLTAFVVYFFVLSAEAQVWHYDLKKDNRWVDSLKMMVKFDVRYADGYEANQYRNGYLRQLRYFNNCVKLGLYYEKLYKKNIITSNREAVKFYDKVADHGNFPEERKFYKASAIKNNVIRKLAAMYFSGDGVKQDKNKSLQLALEGSAGYDGFYSYYSRKYYGCICAVVSPSYYSLPDAVELPDSMSLEFNLFALQSFKYSSSKQLHKYLRKIAISMKQKFIKNPESELQIISYAQTNIRSQSRAYHLVPHLAGYFIEKHGIPSEKIKTNVEILGADMEFVDFFFVKK